MPPLDGTAQTAETTTDDHRDGDPHSRNGHPVVGGRHAPLRDGRTAADDMPVDSQVVADAGGTRFITEGNPAVEKPPPEPRHVVRNIALISLLVGVGVLTYKLGVPLLRQALDTVSTDDAFVAGHITNVSPRIEAVVTEVHPDQNDRVEAGQLLVRLDREPFEIAVAQSRASLLEAEANVANARAMTKGQLATARQAFFSRRNVQDQLRRSVASLRAQVAAVRAAESGERLAEIDQRRLDNLVKRGSASQSELDTRNNTLDTAREQTKQAWAAVQQTRAALGLPPEYGNPLQVPKDLEEQQSNVQSAVSTIGSSLAQIGIDFDLHDIPPGEAFEQVLHMDSSAGIDKAFDGIVDKAPAVRVANANVVMSRASLRNAELQLSWTEVRAEVDGYVQDRQVNPGNRVEPGQTLMSIRPTYVWVAANYKETQIHQMRIGMPVDLHVDAYPGRVFQGRVAGFSPGTGLSESLLPPENATGNYIKVTQRLPVRIELAEPNPDDTPLFSGLSVVPRVRIKEKPTGPGAGGRLHTFGRLTRPDVGGGPAGSRPENRGGPKDSPQP